jgi:hypothetical protein
LLLVHLTLSDGLSYRVFDRNVGLSKNTIMEIISLGVRYT